MWRVVGGGRSAAKVPIRALGMEVSCCCRGRGRKEDDGELELRVSLLSVVKVGFVRRLRPS